jgi:hypothetical protein
MGRDPRSAAHDPVMMLALFVQCVLQGAALLAGDRAIARFRQRHETALADLFGQVLELCAEANLVEVGVIAIDGTKVHANASQHAARDYQQVAKETLEQAAETDRLEDERYGEKRGDELPPELSTEQGRRGWLREAKNRLDEGRAAEAEPIPRSHPERLSQSKRRLEEELAVECAANAAYKAYRARGVMKDGRRLGHRGRPRRCAHRPAPVVRRVRRAALPAVRACAGKHEELTLLLEAGDYPRRACC